MTLGKFIKKTASHVVARLSVQHACLRKRDMQALSGPGDCDIHQAPLLFETPLLRDGILVGEKALLETCDEYQIELESLGRVNRHQLHCILTFLGLVVPCFQRCMSEKSNERRHGLGRFGTHSGIH